MSKPENPEGVWLVEIRDWDKPTRWLTKEVLVERFPSGGLEIVEEDHGRLRHYKDVRKWIEKRERAKGGDREGE